MGIKDSFKKVFGAKPKPIEEPSQEPVAIEPEEPEAVSAGDRTYTVQSGDTLWKIAEEMYGNGSNYMKIFEANSELLENPDHILPGQELLIPDLNN
jgi:nucleoid-associated protein YgaU